MGRAPVLIPEKSQKRGVAQKQAREIVAAATKDSSKNIYQKDPGRVRSISVKLDSDRYRRINKARFDIEMSAQDIFIEAIDLWFKAKHI